MSNPPASWTPCSRSGLVIVHAALGLLTMSDNGSLFLPGGPHDKSLSYRNSALQHCAQIFGSSFSTLAEAVQDSTRRCTIRSDHTMYSCYLLPLTVDQRCFTRLTGSDGVEAHFMTLTQLDQSFFALQSDTRCVEKLRFCVTGQRHLKRFFFSRLRRWGSTLQGARALPGPDTPKTRPIL